MKYSDSMRWFYNVQCEEQDEIIDCLVDITELESRVGYTLIEENGLLKAYPSHHIQSLHHSPNSITILGMIKRKDCSLKGMD